MSRWLTIAAFVITGALLGAACSEPEASTVSTGAASLFAAGEEAAPTTPPLVAPPPTTAPPAVTALPTVPALPTSAPTAEPTAAATAVTVPAATSEATAPPEPTAPAAPTATPTPSPTAPPPAVPATTTSCTQVAHIGDSTGVLLFRPEWVGGTTLTATARYKAVGVEMLLADNADGRGIVENIAGQRNAHEVATDLKARGFTGCWVLMIGTNDAASIAAGSSTNAESRIRTMMSIIGDDPVVWIDTLTQTTVTSYRYTAMTAWNQELYRVVAEYPNGRVLRWTDIVRPEWFSPDGVHYAIEGNTQRARAAADALVTFFPES